VEHGVDPGAALPLVSGLDHMPDSGAEPGHSSPSDRVEDSVSDRMEDFAPRSATVPTTWASAPRRESGQVSQP
jgi:hypothetical protein